MKVNLKSDYIKTVLFLILMMGSVFAFWYGLKAVLKTEYPLLAVASGSMEPTLNVGDLIVVQGGLNISEINAALAPDGDIIVFWRPSGYGENDLIVHRAIAKTLSGGEWKLQTKGDNPHNSIDPWDVGEEHLVGKVIGYIPLIGHIPLFVREPHGMIIIVALMLILIFVEFLPIWKRKTKPSENASLSGNVSQKSYVLEKTSIIMINAYPQIFLFGNFSFYIDFDK